MSKEGSDLRVLESRLARKVEEVTQAYQELGLSSIQLPPVPPSETLVQEEPRIVGDYYKSAGDLKIFKERLYDRRMTYLEETGRREDRKLQGLPLGTSDQEFRMAHLKELAELQDQLQAAESSAKELRRQCLAQNIELEEDEDDSFLSDEFLIDPAAEIDLKLFRQGTPQASGTFESAGQILSYPNFDSSIGTWLAHSADSEQVIQSRPSSPQSVSSPNDLDPGTCTRTAASTASSVRASVATSTISSVQASVATSSA
ncbi:hypothetical protein EJ06DRAFT_281936 [Trichodelitschia bisporula]|uniref:Uncharacterized protein n=1 Tax=Trichodelitschia bisporula TaxID=703511 RepID=A0A6G1I636_9PEZI|nr:hypothetical protein EJ06DRAFT_281936 [Trichodelitschia bisporula]